MAGRIRVGATSGLRGHFAVLYDDDEPILTGMTCKNFEEAKADAITWAKADFGDEWREHCDYSE